MNGLFCKYQENMVDDGSGITVSACRCPDAAHQHSIVSELICSACHLREEPTAEERHLNTHMQEQRGGDILETRPLAVRTKILEDYCLKCKHCDSVDKVCMACTCNVRIPVDDYVKYAAHHCPLELW
jgi:hypothetical protein